MGGFQAVAGALGETGENAATGINNALNEALKVRAQLHGENVDQAHITLQQQAQQQAYTIAQQQHELTRQQILQSGWRDMGATMGPNGYVRNFYNDQTKENRAIPISGTPPDSMENMLNHFKTLSGMTDQDGHPVLTAMQAKQIAFKMPQLYREGPVGMLEGFTDYAREMNEKGISAVKVPGFGKIDITTPEGQAQFSQTMMDTVYQRSLMAAMWKTQHPTDMSGWSANEQREFKAVEDKNKAMEQILLKVAEARMNSIAGMDPTAQQAMQKELMDSVLPLYNETQAKEAEINARHGRVAPTSAAGVGGPPAGAISAKGVADGTPLLQNGKPSGWVAKGGTWVRAAQ